MSADPASPGADKRIQGSLAPSIRRIGPYEVIDLLGQGGMAAVYLARDTRSGEEVAVKVLARMRASWIHRFSREFEAAKKVDHPNVVRVLEAGEADDMAFYSMERIHGVTASRYVRGLRAKEPLPAPPPMDFRGPTQPVNPRTLDRTLRVAVQLSRAVGAIHEVGIVHRDLKPGNVLVTDGGIVKLVDFGVVKWLEELSSFTQVGHVVGSYSYMSPEQITGTQVDHRADMYGMGVLLYELLTGAPPFRARRPQEFLWLHCTKQPDPVSRSLDGVPTEFDALLLRLLSKEPADRPESMTSIEHELLEILAKLQSRETSRHPDFIRDEESLTDPQLVSHETETEFLEVGSLQEEITLGDPGDATRPIDVSEIEELRKLKAYRAETQRRTPLAEPEKTTSALHDDSPTAPVFDTEATEHRSVPSRETEKQANGAAALAALVSPRHIGRKDEIEVLLSTLKTVRKAGAHGVLIEGEEGVGKTRLLHTFRGLAWVKGARVAIGACEEGGDVLCGPFQEILLRLAGPGLARSHREALLGPDKAILYRFFPKLVPENEATQGEDHTRTLVELDPSSLFRAVADTLRRAAEHGPLVVAIEDIHWADSGTARLAEALLRRLSTPNPAKVLLVFTYRAESVNDDSRFARALLHSLATMENVQVRALSPLDQPEMRELIRSLCVDVPVANEVIRRLARAARGNPRFAVEVARSLIEAGGAEHDGDDWELPATLLAVHERRLAGLPSPARAVARCIAVLGGSPPVAIVQTASGLADNAFEIAITELERRRVANVDRRSDPELSSLHSNALRAAVLGSLSNSQARSLHRRAAAAWLKWAGRDPTVSGHVARHFYAAGEDRVAIPHALRAALSAKDALDTSALIRWMTLIGDLTDLRDELPEDMVYSYYMLRWQVAFDEGRLTEAGPLLASATEFAPDTRSSLETGLACARLHSRDGRYTDAVKVCRRGLREARDSQFHDIAVRFARQGALAARQSGDLESSLAWLAEADLTLRRSEAIPELAVRIGWTRSAVLLDLGRSNEAVAEIHRVLELAIQIGEESAEAGLRNNLAVISFRLGELKEAVSHLERAQTLFTELGLREDVGRTECSLAHILILQGRVSQGTQLARSAFEAGEQFSLQHDRLGAAKVLLLAAVVRNDHELADFANQAIDRDLPQLSVPGERGANCLLMQAHWFRSRGELAVAWNHMGRATRALGSHPTPPMKLKTGLVRAQLMWTRGQLREALQVLNSIITAAHLRGGVRLLYEAEALRFATICGLGETPEPLRDSQAQQAEDALLEVTTSYYLWKGEQSRGNTAEAEKHRRNGLKRAEACGFLYWTQRLEERKAAD